MKRSPLLRKTPMRSFSRLARVSIPAQRKPLRAMSLKRQTVNRERRRVVEEMCADGPPVCFVPGCGRLADDPHELLSRGRGGSIVDPANIRPVCRTCHNVITTMPAWAEARGYALPSPPRRKATP